MDSVVPISATAKWLFYPHIYILFCFYTLSHYGLSQLLNIVSVLSIRTLLSIHSKRNSFHLLNPNSQSIPHPLPLSNHESVLCVCESAAFLRVLHSVVCCIFRSYISVISYSIYPSLSDFIVLSRILSSNSEIHVKAQCKVSSIQIVFSLYLPSNLICQQC